MFYQHSESDEIKIAKGTPTLGNAISKEEERRIKPSITKYII